MGQTMQSIGSIIRDVIEEVGPAEAGEIADAVLARIDEADYARYLKDLIAGRVASEAGHLRAKTTPARKSMSTEQQLIRDVYWPKFLNQVISLPNGYKKLADATVDDLVFVAQMRRSQANDLLSKADQFEALAALMRKTGAKTLGRLDPEIGERTIAA